MARVPVVGWQSEATPQTQISPTTHPYNRFIITLHHTPLAQEKNMHIRTRPILFPGAPDLMICRQQTENMPNYAITLKFEISQDPDWNGRLFEKHDECHACL
jgi:hypothetical protein